MKRLLKNLKSLLRQLKQGLKRVKWALRGKWIPGSFCLALILVASLSAISYRNINRLTQNAAQLRRSNEMLQTLFGVSLTLARTEFRQSDHTLASKSALKEDETNLSCLKPQLTKLKGLATFTNNQRQRADALNSLVSEREKLFQRLLVQRQTNDLDISASEVLVTQIRQNQNEIRQVVADLKNKEEDLLKAQTEYFETGSENRITLELIGTFSTFVFLFSIYGLASYQRKKRQQAETKQQSLVQAKVLSELKLQFFSLVSHEFRTPLSHILGSAQLLEETLKPLVEPAKLKNLYRIQASSKLVTQLLNDVLTLARADAGKLEYNPAQVEMQTFCLNLIEDFQASSESQRSIQFFQEGDRTHAWIDERLTYSILSNLLSNAIKYSSPTSTIAFTFVGEPNAIAFRVSDEGIGIAPEDLARLYNPFIRGKNAGESIGTGLGLAVVKKCLDLHQGQILVDSQLGVGTTFTVRMLQSGER